MRKSDYVVIVSGNERMEVRYAHQNFERNDNDVDPLPDAIRCIQSATLELCVGNVWLYGA